MIAMRSEPVAGLGASAGHKTSVLSNTTAITRISDIRIGYTVPRMVQFASEPPLIFNTTHRESYWEESFIASG